MVVEPKWYIDLEFIDQGDIFFFYKPKKNIERVKGIEDIGRFYFILASFESEQPDRYFVLGKNRMPEIANGSETGWGFIQTVGGRGFATVRKVSEQTPTKDTARPAGEGLYAVVKHKDHTHLLYSLELPSRIGEVQKELNIYKEGSLIINIRNPLHGASGSITDRLAHELNIKEYQNRKFVPVFSKEILNIEGAEILLRGSKTSSDSLGISVDKEEENERTAEIFNELQMSRHLHPTDSLLKGKWI